jgi:hypothetical protein
MHGKHVSMSVSIGFQVDRFLFVNLDHLHPTSSLHLQTPEHAVLDPPTRLILGVCAMDKKAQSKPMREILQRMTSFNEFEVIVFGDKVYLHAPVYINTLYKPNYKLTRQLQCSCSA